MWYTEQDLVELSSKANKQNAGLNYSYQIA